MTRPVGWGDRLFRALIAILWTLGLFAGASLACAQTASGWRLVWADEFDQADGTPPSSAKWNYDIGTGCPNLCGWGNGELQYYTDRTNNARIEGGCLVIEAHAEEFGGAEYTSARLLTQGKRHGSWTYGRMEARIQVPSGQGLWPAFWMLGADFDTVGWPDCGEIDIMENLGREPRTVHGTVHGPFSWGGHFQSGGSWTNAVDLAEGFHVYAIEWEPNVIRWYFDDTHYFTATPDSIGGGVWAFDHPHFFLLNVAVGGSWPGYPDETTAFPQQMLVDYVRAYEQTSVPTVAVQLSLVGDQVELSFPSENGVAYEVAYKNDLDTSPWTPIETLIGNGAVLSVTYPVVGSSRVYIVREP